MAEHQGITDGTDEDVWSRVERQRISRDRFLKSAAAAGIGVSGLGAVGNAFAGTGANPLLPKYKGVSHFIANVTSLESMNSGLLYAWKQLGQSSVSQSYDGDPQKAISQAELFGALGARMAAGYLVSDSLYTTYAKTLAKQKIDYVNIANAVPWRFPLEAQFNRRFLAHMQASFADESYLVAKAVFKAAGGEGEMIHLLGVQGDASDTQRSYGVQLALKEFPKIKVVAEQAVDWDKVKAQQATDALVPAHPNVRIIFGQNDSVATGVVASLRAQRKKGVFVGGVDGDPEFLQMIVDGDYAVATAAARLDLVGVIAATRLFDELHGAGDKYDPLESMLRTDDVFVDTPAAAQALLNLTSPGKPLPYDARALSRHLHPKDWKAQELVQVMDPYFEWGPTGPNPNPQPASFRFPAAYKAALNPANAARLNKMWSSRVVDVFAPVRAKAKYKGNVLGTLRRQGLVPNYRPYTPPKGYR